MKAFLAITCGLVLGAIAGVAGTYLYYSNELFQASMTSVRQTGEQSVTMAAFNLALLEEIEAGHQESIKPPFARQGASFYLTFHDFQPMASGTRKLMTH